MKMTQEKEIEKNKKALEKEQRKAERQAKSELKAKKEATKPATKKTKGKAMASDKANSSTCKEDYAGTSVSKKNSSAGKIFCKIHTRSQASKH